MNQDILVNFINLTGRVFKGQALICMAKQISDVIEIEYATDNALPKLFPPQEDLDYILIEKTHPTEKIVKLKFRSLDNSMRFWPAPLILYKIIKDPITKNRLLQELLG